MYGTQTYSISYDDDDDVNDSCDDDDDACDDDIFDMLYDARLFSVWMYSSHTF